jgi:uncharacterized protein YbcC (UPF0753/DUF2309 family)
MNFNEQHVLHELKHYLPSQTPLKDFIHHNTLHGFQNMKFFDAIFKASKIFGYQVTLQLSEYRELYKIGRIEDAILERIIIQKKGQENLQLWKQNLLTKNYDSTNTQRIGTLRANWKLNYKIDLENLVQPLLFRIICSYLDQGISVWTFPSNNKGFLASMRELELNSFSSFFKTKRAKSLLLDENIDLHSLLKIIVGDERYFEQYLFDQQFSHQGWSGIVSSIEDQPHSLLDSKIISLRDWIALELIMEIDALDFEFGTNWKPLSHLIQQAPVHLFEDISHSELLDTLTLWQEAFEWNYYDEVLGGLALQKTTAPAAPTHSDFDAIFCIDERECSFRRHIESTNPNCNTYGTPGFFSVEFYFQPFNGKFYDKLCPAPVTPRYLIKEFDVQTERKHELLYHNKSHTFFVGSLIALTLGIWAGLQLFLNIFRPKMSPAISNAFTLMDQHSKLTVENKNIQDRENNLQVGFTVEEMSTRVESLLKNIGLIKNFPPLVYVIAHGSSSANNPHHGAHDCGACSGRPGSVNARVFAFMANHPEVRKNLTKQNIFIPIETQFVGCLHDTASDEIAYYDVECLSPSNSEKHNTNQKTFDRALDLNAKERSRRFASIDTKMNLKKIREAIRKRSVSMFEPRPELGHGTNTLCIIGNRKLSKSIFLDRRAFLNSYDSKSDPNGDLLAGIMKPIGPVCGGINLEYYFSRVDNSKLGAGTKLPHNVMGLVGVANSSDGDLRPGLPLQMIEVHDPVRLLVIVEHSPEIVLKTIQSAPDMYEWYNNEWVHLVAVEPDTLLFHYFRNGKFEPYQPLKDRLHTIQDVNSLIESAKKMETNHIVDATQENLKVYSLN